MTTDESVTSNGNNANTLLGEGFIPVAEQKPKHYDDNGVRAWVWAAWSNNEQRLKVFADKVGTDSCTADYWKPL